ncbi:MAG: hypothetical protein RL333_268 [Pseudomonadota bacterium]|jgi:SH3 domain protein
MQQLPSYPEVPKMRHLFRSFLILPVLIMAWPALADNLTRFVVKDHPVALRSGFSDQDHALATLKPGEAVKVLKDNKKEHQQRIQRESGEMGWVESQDLQDASPEAATPAQAGTEDNQAKSPEQLQQELGRLQSELVQVRAASADILRIQAERDQLQSTVISLKRELETLSQEKNMLDEDQQQTWFLIGGVVLLGGILIGILLPRISVRRRNQWGSF